MSSWLHGIILGVVQGLTEFFPVSSSGHLVLVPVLFGWPDQGLVFDTVLHLGTLVALLIFFGSDLHSLLQRVLHSDPVVSRHARRFVAQVGVATLPALIIGFLTKDLIETIFRGWKIVVFDLVLWSFVLWYADHHRQRVVNDGPSIEQLSWKQILLIGFAQPLALFPGTSRSGMTITAGLFVGLSRETAARFSFFLSIPITMAAGGYGLLRVIKEGLGPQDSLGMLFAGFLAAVIAGTWAIRFLLSYVAKKPFTLFVIYRLALASLMLCVQWFCRCF